MKKLIFYALTVGALIYVAKKAMANAQNQIENRAKYLEEVSR